MEPGTHDLGNIAKFPKKTKLPGQRGFILTEERDSCPPANPHS